MAAAATEDTLHSLEQRYMLLQRDHERVKKEKDELQRRLTDASADAAQANAKVASLQQTLSRHEASGAEQKRLTEGKVLEVTRLTELVARTNKVRLD